MRRHMVWVKKSEKNVSFFCLDLQGRNKRKLEGSKVVSPGMKMG